MPPKLDELYEKQYVAAYGCNRTCKEAIGRVFDEREEAPLFLFFEFFTSQPLPKTPEGLGEQWEKNVYVLAPFAKRLAEHAVVVPYISDGNVEAKFRSTPVLANLRLVWGWKGSINTKFAFNHWREQTGDVLDRSKDALAIRDWARECDPVSCSTYDIGLVPDWSWKAQTEARYDDSLSKTSAKALAILYEPYFIGEKCSTATVPGIFVPIASSRLFYGGIWIMFPSETGASESLQRTVGLRVAQLIDETYLPVLAVLHEHWLEHLHDDGLDREKKTHLPAGHPFELEIGSSAEGRTAKSWNVYLKIGDDLGSIKKRRSVAVADEIESLFVKLWTRRNHLWSEYVSFDESLVFKSYLVCSQPMVHLLYKVILAASRLRKSKDTLPACLVVGGAGSGKETLAKMLRLFSGGPADPTYCAGTEYVVNLAAIRPAPVTAVVVTGLNLEGNWGKDKFDVAFRGILQRIREKEKFPTLRLDEFNSMDPDSQGVLLRFLDNSEVVPLGALGDDSKGKTDCLVIGIMNEDPEDISRERAMEFFRSGQYLGGFLGDILYEHFIRIRRLRPDVMYRMIRNGKFVIPPLRERPGDVPLLFHVFVAGELKDLDKVRKKPKPDEDNRTKNERSVHVSLEALNRLTGPDLLWPGNVRQLQALAKCVVGCLQRQPLDGPRFVVTLHILEEALREAGLVPSATRTAAAGSPFA